MYERIRLWFRALTLTIPFTTCVSGVWSQVQVTGTVSYQESVLASQSLGFEHLNLIGIGHDPDDGVTFLACSTNTNSPCPSSDNIHVYRHDTQSNQWVFDGSINHPGEIDTSYVDVEGDRIAIGRSFYSGSIGNDNVDVYKRGPLGVWSHEGTYRPADNFVGDFFGFSVSLDGDLLAIGAPQEGDDPRASQIGPGAVYVYRFQNGIWVQEDKVIASDGQDGDYFGDEVAINATPTGWRLLVAAPDASTDQGGINQAGAVYLIEKDASGTVEHDKLTGSTDSQVTGDLGGDGIAMENDLVAVAENNRMYYYSITTANEFQPLSIASHSATRLFSRPDINNRAITAGSPLDDPPIIRVLNVSPAGTVSEQTFGLPTEIGPDDGFGFNVFTNGSFIGSGVAGLDLAGENAGGVWTQVLNGASYPNGLILEGVGTPSGRFGHSIAANDEWVAIGAPSSFDECNPDARGSVRILRTDGGAWATTEFLRPPPGSHGSAFGYATAIDHSTLAVSMPGYIIPGSSLPNGAVLLYEQTGNRWSHVQTVIGPTPDMGFGESVSLDGDHLIIGAPDTPTGGHAYFYRRNMNGSWDSLSNLSLTNASAGAEFARSVSLNGDHLLVGAPQDGGGMGSVHLFIRQGDQWILSHNISIPNLMSGSQAGAVVAQDDVHLFIGIPGNATVPGRVAVVPTLAAPGTLPMIISSPNSTAIGFGGSVAVHNNLLSIGYEDESLGECHVYAFNGTSFQLIQSIASPTVTNDSGFGTQTAIGANTLFVGAPTDDSPGVPEGGQTHIYEVELRFTVPECDMDMRPDRVQWLEDETPEPSEWFANSVEVDEGYAIVGVPFERHSFVHDGQVINANNAGKAVIFERTALRHWTPVAQFRGSNLDSNPSTGSHADWLGQSVDIERNVAVAGGVQALDEISGLRSGSVRVYQRGLTGWIESGELFPTQNYDSNADPIREFGSAVDLDSTATLLAVGAANSAIGATGTGAGYIYELTGSGWIESNLLTPATSNFGDHFGESASVEEGWAAFGAPDDQADPGGSVHVYQKNSLGSWTLHATLTVPTSSIVDEFGSTLELSRSDMGLILVVGAPRSSNMSVNSVGAAFVYLLDESNLQWNLIQRLDPEYIRTSALYGSDVSVDHNTIAIGGPLIQNSNMGTSWTGGVEMYNLNTMTGSFDRRTTIRPDQSEWGNANGWGYSIGLSGGTVFLGTHLADGEPYTPANNNINSGALLAFDIVCIPECPADFDGDGTLSFFDVSQFISAYQAMDPAADVNGDGTLDFFDVSAFLASYSAGC